jgi:hypothetical protein
MGYCFLILLNCFLPSLISFWASLVTLFLIPLQSFHKFPFLWNLLYENCCVHLVVNPCMFIYFVTQYSELQPPFPILRLFIYFFIERSFFLCMGSRTLLQYGVLVLILGGIQSYGLCAVSSVIILTSAVCSYVRSLLQDVLGLRPQNLGFIDQVRPHVPACQMKDE